MSVRQMVIFNVDRESYGVDIGQVIEIIKPLDIVKVPNTPEFIEGLINLRGKVHAIFNLRKKFKLPAIEMDDNTKIIIVSVNGTNIGFIVDAVNEIVRVEESDIESTPSVVTGIHSKYISGVAKLADKMIIMLDLNIVLSAAETDAVKSL